MSMHKIPLTDEERAGLVAHGLDVDTPSQLSDVFRLGMKWQAAQAPEGCTPADARLLRTANQQFAGENERRGELLREFIDLCAAGDIDENSIDDGLGWGDLIRAAKLEVGDFDVKSIEELVDDLVDAAETAGMACQRHSDGDPYTEPTGEQTQADIDDAREALLAALAAKGKRRG